MKRLAFMLPFVAAGLLISQPAPREQVGPLPEGSFLLNSGWRLRPAGHQVPVGTFPMRAVPSRDGKFLLVLNGGYEPPTISVIDLTSNMEISRTAVPDGWLGMAFTPKGDRLYVGGGSQASVFEFAFSEGKLSAARTFPVVPAAKREPKDFIGDVAISPDGRLIYAADLYRDSVVVINPQSGMVIERFKTGRRPYRILFHPDGKSYLVSSWADGSVSHYDAGSGELIETIRVAPHPTDLLWLPGGVKTEEGELPIVARLFVAASNTNSVYVFGMTESKQSRRLDLINVAMTPRQPVGMTPSALASSADGKSLYVVCSDVNALAVVTLAEEYAQVEGFIPTGWYPTAVAPLPGGRLAIVNGRGSGSFPNPEGPNPLRTASPPHQGIPVAQYVGAMQKGSVSIVNSVNPEILDGYSEMVAHVSAFRDDKLDDAGTGQGNPVPTFPGLATPIQHVIYIVKENRTYDQILGDIKEGNGDPNLVRFPEPVTPNHHKLAREFVLLDNFYANADVDADGQSWATAAIASDYVQKLWPNSYGGRRGQYDYEGGEPAAFPPAGYLWSNAAAAGISLRSYGHFVVNLPQPGADGRQVASVRDPVLAKVTNVKYRGADLNYLDTDRAKVFLEDLKQFEAAGAMPKLMLLRLGNDRTYGTMAGHRPPAAMVADNDHALGMIIEAVSRSRFWPATAIFVLEDDAQDGADHIDSHRSPAFVISPYVKRHTVNSTMYNTTSMLRTMELILGLRPMTTFDAGARPMSALFQTTPDVTPYQAVEPRASIDGPNPTVAASAHRNSRIAADAASGRTMGGGDSFPHQRNSAAR